MHLSKTPVHLATTTAAAFMVRLATLTKLKHRQCVCSHCLVNIAGVITHMSASDVWFGASDVKHLG